MSAESTPNNPADPPPKQPNDLETPALGQAGDNAAELTSEDFDLLVRAAAEMQGAGSAHRSAKWRPGAAPGRTGVVASSATPADSGFPELPEFTVNAVNQVNSDRIAMLSDVDLNVRIELGRTRMLVEDVIRLEAGSVVELDKLAGDPVDVFANDRLIARGEVLVLNDSFCVRISEVFGSDPHRVV